MNAVSAQQFWQLDASGITCGLRCRPKAESVAVGKTFEQNDQPLGSIDVQLAVHLACLQAVGSTQICREPHSVYRSKSLGTSWSTLECMQHYATTLDTLPKTKTGCRPPGVVSTRHCPSVVRFCPSGARLTPKTRHGLNLPVHKTRSVPNF